MKAVGTAAADGQPDESWLVRAKHRMRSVAQGVLAPLVRGLARLGVNPDWLTILGCLLSLIAAMAFLEGAFRWGSAALVCAGLCDILDGQLARELGFQSRFGAFLDSTLDRFSEAMVFTGIAGYYMARLLALAENPAQILSELARGLEPGLWARLSLMAVLAMVGAFLVSYTRARAEGLGLECKVGWAERPERLIALIVAGFFGVGRIMVVVLLLLTILSFVTAGQRVVHVWKSTRDAEASRPDRVRTKGGSVDKDEWNQG